MIIIRRLFVLILITICCGMIANADDNKSYKCEGNTYSSTGRVKSNSSTPITTGFTWIDSKGISYPVFMSNSGSCFIIKYRKSDNKEYRDYLGKEISIEICKKLCKEYKGNKK